VRTEARAKEAAEAAQGGRSNSTSSGRARTSTTAQPDQTDIKERREGKRAREASAPCRPTAASPAGSLAWSRRARVAGARRTLGLGVLEEVLLLVGFLDLLHVGRKVILRLGREKSGRGGEGAKVRARARGWSDGRRSQRGARGRSTSTRRGSTGKRRVDRNGENGGRQGRVRTTRMSAVCPPTGR
jgi:hypothetical protein